MTENNSASSLDASAWLVIAIALLKAAKAIWDEMKNQLVKTMSNFVAAIAYYKDKTFYSLSQYTHAISCTTIGRHLQTVKPDTKTALCLKKRYAGLKALTCIAFIQLIQLISVGNL